MGKLGCSSSDPKVLLPFELEMLFEAIETACIRARVWVVQRQEKTDCGRSLMQAVLWLQRSPGLQLLVIDA